MTIQLYEHPLSPFCRSVKVLAKLIGVEIEPVFVDLFKGEHLKPEYMELNPFHSVPALNDNGFRIFESRAIMTYLTSKYAPDSDLYPKDLKKRALVDAMLNFDSALLGAFLGIRTKSLLTHGRDIEEAMIERGRDVFVCLERIFSKQKYASGDHLTLSDIAIVHSLTYAEAHREDLGKYKNLHEYYTRTTRELGPAFKEIHEIGHPMLVDLIQSKSPK